MPLNYAVGRIHMTTDTLVMFVVFGIAGTIRSHPEALKDGLKQRGLKSYRRCIAITPIAFQPMPSREAKTS
jgi:hypothetical protein